MPGEGGIPTETSLVVKLVIFLDFVLNLFLSVYAQFFKALNTHLQGVFFSLGLPLKCLSTEKLIWARLGVSRTTYVNVDSPNLGFPYFLGGYQLKKNLYNYFRQAIFNVGLRFWT